MRKSLENREQVGGSVRRAAVELLLIVVGVLIALSADQWRTSRADARTEAAYLAGLADDISAALGELETEVERTRVYLAASAELSKLPRRDAPISEDSLAALVGDALFNIVSWDGRVSTLDDLKNTGRLGLISDPGIRRELAEFDALNAGILAAEDDILQTQHHTLDPYLIRTSDLPRLIRHTAPAATPYVGPPVGRAQAALLADAEFQNVVALRIVLLRNLEANYLEMREHLVGLSELLRQHVRS